MSAITNQTRRFSRILDTLWHINSAPQVTAALLVLLALILGLATMFPQLPRGLKEAEIDRWLTTTAGQFPSAGTFLRSIGAFNLLHSAWTRAILAALALNLMLRTAAQAPSLKGIRQASVLALPPPHVVTRRATLPGPLEPVITNLRKALEPGYAVIVESDTVRSQLFAQRRPVGALGPLFVSLGLLLLLAGLVLNDAAGWRISNVALAPGDTTPLNLPGALQISLNDTATQVSATQVSAASVPATPGSSGDDQAARAELTVMQAGSSRTVRTSLARPAHWGNLWLSQQTTGPTLTVSGFDQSRQALVMQSLDSGGEVGPTLRFLFHQTQSEQGFAIPTRNLTFRAVSYAALPEQGIEGPVFLIEAYRGEDIAPAVTELVADEGSLVLDDVTLTLQRERYVELDVAYLPGLIPMLLGGLLVLSGVVIAAYWSMARVWANLALDGEQVLAIVAVAGATEPQAEIERLLHAARASEAADAA